VAFYTAAQFRHVVASEHGRYDVCRIPATSAQVSGMSGWRGPLYAFVSTSGVLCLDAAKQGSVRLQDTSQEDLLEALFGCITGAAGVPMFETYMRDPRPHRLAVTEAIARCGLSRPHRLAREIVTEF
jgi:hypothetical protein